VLGDAMARNVMYEGSQRETGITAFPGTQWDWVFYVKPRQETETYGQLDERLQLVLIAQVHHAWAQTLCFDGELAVAEPKQLRHRVCKPLPSSPTPDTRRSCGSDGPGHGPPHRHRLPTPPRAPARLSDAAVSTAAQSTRRAQPDNAGRSSLTKSPIIDAARTSAPTKRLAHSRSDPTDPGSPG
jgi:hypothetical protein